jgi:hypothetical protein
MKSSKIMIKQALASNQASSTLLLGLLAYFIWHGLLARSIKLASSQASACKQLA